MTKYQFISEVYQQELCSISTPQRWQEFLTSACRNYKCTFDEQLLIFAQRPNARAVLEIEKWNKQFNRWVNKGATGIAVFDKSSQSKRLKYYFDIQDTNGNVKSKEAPIWQMKKGYETEVITTLENTFGALKEKETIEDAIFSASENATVDNLGDYLKDLKYYIADSFLEETSEEYIHKSYSDLVKNSMAFMIFTRLNLDTKKYFTDDDFSKVIDFNTKDTANALGVATSDIGEMALREIATTIIALEKDDRDKISTFAQKNSQEYNGNKQEKEREFEYGKSDLQQSGGLSSAQFDTAAGRENSPWEICTASEKYLEQHRKVMHINLLTSGKLSEHLMEVEEQAHKMMESITQKMAQAQGVTEKLKATDQMKWVQEMNNIRSMAQEIVMRDLIYN